MELGARRILVTGIGSVIASRLAARLEADDRVAYVGGVDLTEPVEGLTRTEFVRADLSNPLVGKVIESTAVDTIVHLAITAEPQGAGGRSRMKERNVIGTMQLLASAQQAPRLRRLVLKSTTAVYGSSYADPALFREDSAPRTPPRSGYAKDAVEVEGYGRAFGRRRRDVDLTVLRFANFIGPRVETPLTGYLALPVVPTVMGYDPRLQLCHEDDAVEVLLRAVLGHHPGIVNVAGPGIVYLSQAVRMAGKAAVPVPLPLAEALAGAMRRQGRVDFSPEQLAVLRFGRVGDLTRLRTQWGYEPRFSSRAALADFLAAGRVAPLVRPDAVARAEQRFGDVLVSMARRGRALRELVS